MVAATVLRQTHTGTHRYTQVHTGTHRYTGVHVGGRHRPETNTQVHRYTQVHTGTQGCRGKVSVKPIVLEKS